MQDESKHYEKIISQIISDPKKAKNNKFIETRVHISYIHLVLKHEVDAHMSFKHQIPSFVKSLYILKHNTIYVLYVHHRVQTHFFITKCHKSNELKIALNSPIYATKISQN